MAGAAFLQFDSSPASFRRADVSIPRSVYKPTIQAMGMNLNKPTRGGSMMLFKQLDEIAFIVVP